MIMKWSSLSELSFQVRWPPPLTFETARFVGAYGRGSGVIAMLQPQAATSTRGGRREMTWRMALIITSRP